MAVAAKRNCVVMLLRETSYAMDLIVRKYCSIKACVCLYLLPWKCVTTFQLD